MYKNIDGDLFHDIFEISRTYLLNGELVDLHDNYNDSTCYLSDDGLSGFAITKNGDLISVFNLDKSKKGFLSAISSVVKENAKTLDCYVSPNQNLVIQYNQLEAIHILGADFSQLHSVILLKQLEIVAFLNVLIFKILPLEIH